jgi:hypothetical protein
MRRAFAAFTTAGQNIFLNIFLVNHNSTAAQHRSDFRNPGEVSGMDAAAT